jgi:hypothetical protein
MCQTRAQMLEGTDFHGVNRLLFMRMLGFYIHFM